MQQELVNPIAEKELSEVVVQPANAQPIELDLETLNQVVGGVTTELPRRGW